jgi:hypothetical protein
MGDAFDLDWYGPDGNVYTARGYVTGPGDYDDCTWSLELVAVEGPDGPLDWGDCTDTDARDWPEWAHTYAVRAIDSALEARRYGA